MLPLVLPLMLCFSHPAGQPYHPNSHGRSPLLPCSSPQTDRDSSLQSLGRLLTPAVFGTPRQHGLPTADGGLLSDTGAPELAITFASSFAYACLQRCCACDLAPPAASARLQGAVQPLTPPVWHTPLHTLLIPAAVEMLISEYRPLFTQPFNLRRYEADAARQAAAEAARAEAAGMPSSPLLTPIRCERLSVMVPEGLGSPFGDCCATPLAPESPVSAFLAAAMEQAAGSGASSGASSGVSTPSHQAAQPAFTSVAVVPLVGGTPGACSGLSALQVPPPMQPHSPLGHLAHEADAHLEETFSSLLESTISGMLFGGDLLAAEAAPAPAPCGVVRMEVAGACRPSGAADADMQPMSPVAVLPEPASDGGDTSDGSGAPACRGRGRGLGG